MIARKKSKELQKARIQKIQEKIHQILYCDTDWNEHEIYGKRFRKIVERSHLSGVIFRVEEDALKEYRRRVEKKLKGIEPLDKSLLFYKILKEIDFSAKTRESLMSELDVHSEECINGNLLYMEKSGLIERSGEEYRISPHIYKLFAKTKVK